MDKKWSRREKREHKIRTLLSKIYQRQKGSARKHENFLEIYLMESNRVNSAAAISAARKKGKKRGVNPGNMLKTQLEKMSAFRLSKMLMKTNCLARSFQDIAENKGSYRIVTGNIIIYINYVLPDKSWPGRAKSNLRYNEWVSVGMISHHIRPKRAGGQRRRPNWRLANSLVAGIGGIEPVGESMNRTCGAADRSSIGVVPSAAPGGFGLDVRESSMLACLIPDPRVARTRIRGQAVS
jgi:hypothetical protein